MRALVASILVLAACGGGSDVDEVVGAACIDDRDCEDRCETGGEFPGGFCTLTCLDDSDCPSDTFCTDVRDGVCLFDCALDTDCDFLGFDYRCREKRDTFDRVIFVCLGG